MPMEFFKKLEELKLRKGILQMEHSKKLWLVDLMREAI